MNSSKNKRTTIYEGNAKILYETLNPNTLIKYFKDDATAFNNQKKGQIAGKGVINNRISAFIMEGLGIIGIQTHCIETLNMREQLVKKVDIIPLEVIVRNYAAGSLSKRFGIEEGMKLVHPMVEFCYKDDELGDPLVSEENIFTFGWAKMHELDEMRPMALRINDYMAGLFRAVNLCLVDFKIEFGRYTDSDEVVSIMLADEISPDSCRLCDMETNKKMDKDRFRRDLGGVEDVYIEVARRLGILDKNMTEK